MAKEFKKTWATQTDIGHHFKLSAVAVGKLLSEAGLRDGATREPTLRALNEGFAKSTPMRNGRAFFMWNRTKIGDLLRDKGLEKVSPVEAETARVFSEMRRYLNTTWDSDKMERLVWQTLDVVFEDTMQKVDKGIRRDVRTNVITKLIAEKIIDHAMLL